jgi:hypothetical protein
MRRSRRLLIALLAATAATVVTPGAAWAEPDPDPATGVLPFDYQDGTPDTAWPALPVTWVGGPAPKKMPPAVEVPSSYKRSDALFAQAVPSAACGDVFGQQSDLVKQATRTNNADGTVTLRVQLNTSLPPEAETRLRDCIWIDSTPNGQWDQATETLFAVDIAPTAFLPDNSTAANDSFVRFRVTITATAADRVCDQAARSEDGDALPPQAAYLVRSNTLCLEGEPPFVIPEASQVALLSLSALAVAGGAYLVVRRRSTPLAA